jgi:hypothetical protein
MDREAQKILLLVLLVAALVGGVLGIWGWFEAGSDGARGLALGSLVIFAPAYYVFESVYNRGRR